MDGKLVTSNSVRELCGGVSDMTLWRWIKDPTLGFPQPIRIGTRRYWREADLSAWLASRHQEQEVAI